MSSDVLPPDGNAAGEELVAACSESAFHMATFGITPVRLFVSPANFQYLIDRGVINPDGTLADRPPEPDHIAGEADTP